uniref:Uncharacterized protein n=1 Tax=Trichogramma kaykai TaxID=54128 RepID=A0ABD2W537_9HYME
MRLLPLRWKFHVVIKIDRGQIIIGRTQRASERANETRAYMGKANYNHFPADVAYGTNKLLHKGTRRAAPCHCHCSQSQNLEGTIDDEDGSR